jgi:putative Mg2+ transporter-C (MgtC) family protein
VLAALAFAFVLLTIGRRLERWLHRMLGGKDERHDVGHDVEQHRLPEPDRRP